MAARTGTYSLISNILVTSAISSITFTAIPSTFTDLIVTMNAIATTNFTGTRIVINSDTSTNYSFLALKGDGTSVTSNRTGTTGNLDFGLINTSRSMNTFVFNDYSNITTFKPMLQFGGPPANRVEVAVATWRSTSAISSIQIVQPADTFAANSYFRLYGIQAGNF